MSMKVVLISLSLCMICTCVAMGSSVADKKENALKDLIAELESPELKEKAVEKYKDILDRDFEKRAKPAVDFFYSLKAKWVLIVALDNKNYQINAYAVQRLKEIITAEKKEKEAVVDDELVVKDLTKRLKKACTLKAGGAEVHIHRRKYKKGIVDILEKVIGTDFGEIDIKHEEDIAVVLQKAKEWLHQKELTK